MGWLAGPQGLALSETQKRLLSGGNPAEGQSQAGEGRQTAPPLPLHFFTVKQTLSPRLLVLPHCGSPQAHKPTSLTVAAPVGSAWSYPLLRWRRCSKPSWEHVWTVAMEGQSSGSIAHSPGLSPAAAVPPLPGQQHSQGLAGRAAGERHCHQRRAWTLLTSPVSHLHGKAKLELQVQTQSRWFLLILYEFKKSSAWGRASPSGRLLEERISSTRALSHHLTLPPRPNGMASCRGEQLQTQTERQTIFLGLSDLFATHTKPQLHACSYPRSPVQPEPGLHSAPRLQQSFFFPISLFFFFPSFKARSKPEPSTGHNGGSAPVAAPEQFSQHRDSNRPAHHGIGARETTQL